MNFSEAVPTLFLLLFNMMGPIGVIPVFAALAGQMDQPMRNAMAMRATLLSLAALAVAVMLGAGVLQSWGVSKGSLILAAGVIMTLTVLRNMIFGGGHAGGDDLSGKAATELAASPLAFPTMVTPQGIGVIIIFVAFFPLFWSKLALFGVAAAMMLLNFAAMRIAHWFMATVGMVPLMLLGAVFGVLQVALGIEMIFDGLTMLARP